MSKDDKIARILFIVFVVALLGGLIRHSFVVDEIHDKPHSVACARITETYWRRGGIFCRIEYTYQGKEYHFPNSIFAEKSISRRTYDSFNVGHTNVLVVFPVNDPQIPFLLEDPEDYQKFNIVSKDTAGIKCEN